MSRLIATLAADDVTSDELNDGNRAFSGIHRSFNILGAYPGMPIYKGLFSNWRSCNPLKLLYTCQSRRLIPKHAGICSDCT